MTTVKEAEQLADNSPAPSIHTPNTSLARRVVAGTWTAVHRGCHRCAAAIVGHPAPSTVSAATGYVVLPTDYHWWTAGAIAALVTGAIAPTGSTAKAELPSLATVTKRRRQLARVRRKWKKAVGINGNLHVVHKPEDGPGSPTRGPGHKEIPRLLRWRTRIYHNGGGWLDWEVVSYRPRMTPVGWVVYADGNNIGAVPAAFRQEIDHMWGTWKARTVIVSPDWRDPAITRLSIVFDDPFKHTVVPEALPPAEEPLGVVLGVDSNGDPVEQSLWLPLLVVGRKGSGKSRLFRRVLQGLCESGQPFKLWLFDPKGGGQEFGWIRDAAWHYESDRRKWKEFVQHFYEAMFEQAQRLSARGWSEAPVSDPEFPLLLIVVDELVTALRLTSDKDMIEVGGVKMSVKDALGDYMTQNRSAGSTLIAGAQQNQKEVLGQIRGLFDFCICLGVNDRETAQIATGDAKLYPAHEIPRGRDYSGQGYAATDDGVVHFRCAHTDDAASALIAEQVAYWTRFYRDAEIERLEELANV